MNCDAAIFCPVRLVTVVDARVLEPETVRFVRLRVPAVRAENAAVPPVIFPTVVEPSVEEPIA